MALYEDITEFLVAELDGEVVGCGAVHVFWEDLAEVRTVAVDPAYVGTGHRQRAAPRADRARPRARGRSRCSA